MNAEPTNSADEPLSCERCSMHCPVRSFIDFAVLPSPGLGRLDRSASGTRAVMR